MTPSPMPDWLYRQLSATQDVGPNAVTRRVRIRTCKTCGRTILAGLDADRCAGNAYADPRPLSPLGEALALVTGLATYELVWTGARLELEYRDQFAIAGHPAGSRNTDVLAEHQCTPSALPSLPSKHIRSAAAITTGDPPF